MLSAGRKSQYSRIEAMVGKTPFVELRNIEVPGNCRIFAKLEYYNPTGSHYDREMVRFLRALETKRRIRPHETRMLETTTGNSGASFAWLCRVLDFPPPTIIMPADMPHARRAQVASYGATLELSDPGAYITGISRRFADVWEASQDLPPDERFFCPKHWEDQIHGVEGMRQCGREMLLDVKHAGSELDYCVLALGNGSSARGIGDVLSRSGVKLLGMEPLESPIVAEFIQYPGFESPVVGDRSHGLIGTGPSRITELYANVRHVVTGKPAGGTRRKYGYLDDILHPSTADCRQMQAKLMDRCGQQVGMSSAGVVLSAMSYIQEHGLKHQQIGVVFYDPAWKYL